MQERYNLKTVNSLPSFPSAADALRAAGLDWDVHLEPLTTESGQIAPARAVCRSDTRLPLGVVGTRYSPVNNLAASSWLDQYIPHGVRITGAEAFKSGERIAMYADIGSAPTEIKRGDAVKLQLVASWSHDGSSGVTGQLRVIRLVCLNGLCLAEDAGRMFNVRHTRSANPSSEAIQNQVRAALEGFSGSVEAFRGLAARPVTTAAVRSYVETVLEMKRDEDNELSTRSENILNGIIARYDEAQSVGRELLAAHEQRQEETRAVESSLLESIIANMDGGTGQTLNGGGTWWNAYNAVTEHLTHDRGRNAETRTESLLFGESARINERALSLALNMSGMN